MNRYMITSVLGKWVVYAFNELEVSIMAKSLIQRDNVDYTIHRLDTEEKQMTNWYDYDKLEMMSLPPVGTRCERHYNGECGRAVCTIISHHKLVIEVEHLIDNYNNGLVVCGENDLIRFRPLDWNKNEGRNKLINIIFDYTQHRRGEGLTYYDIATELYALGYLKLPEDR